MDQTSVYERGGGEKGKAMGEKNAFWKIRCDHTHRHTQTHTPIDGLRGSHAHGADSAAMIPSLEDYHILLSCGVPKGERVRGRGRGRGRRRRGVRERDRERERERERKRTLTASMQLRWPQHPNSKRRKCPKKNEASPVRCVESVCESTKSTVRHTKEMVRDEEVVRLCVSVCECA